MRGPSDRTFSAVLSIDRDEKGIRLIANRAHVVEPKHQSASIEIVSGRRKIAGLQQWQEIRHMRIGEIHLLAETMMAVLFVELSPYARVKGLAVQIERRLKLDKDGRCCLRKLKIELAAFQDPLGGAEEEDFILQDWSAKLRAGIPTQQKRSLAIENLGRIRGIQLVVAVKK